MPFDPDKYLAQKPKPTSTFDPDAYLSGAGKKQPPAAPPSEGIGSKAVKGLMKVANTIDSYTGAPTRAAIYSLQDGNLDIGKAASEFGKQFGEDNQKAPTGKMIAQRAGVPDTALSEVLPNMYSETGDEWLKFQKGGLLDPTASGAAGLGVDVAADPTIVLPVGKIAKYGAKGIAKGTQKIAPGLIKATEAAVDAAKTGAIKSTAKIGEAITGLPARDIETYARNLKEINKRIKTYGEDIAGASDDVRNKFAADIKNKRQTLNAQISETLKKAAPDATVSIDDVIGSLEKSKARLNPKLRGQEIAEIDELIQQVNGLRGENGMASLGDTFDLKEFLQERAKGSYQKNGQMFMPGKAAQAAARDAGSVARKQLNKAAPAIEAANNELTLMHRLEDDINRNLIAAGKPESALLAAGSARGGRNRKNLERLGKITGTDTLGAAEKLSAQRTFTKPGLLPVSSGGTTSTSRTIGTGMIGFLKGGPIGTGLALALSSPAALKAAINAGHISEDVVRGILGVSGKLTDASFRQAVDLVNSPGGDKILGALLRGGMAANRGLIDEETR